MFAQAGLGNILGTDPLASASNPTASLESTLSAMTLPELQNYAAQHKDDPYTVSMALSIANTKKQSMAAMQARMAQGMGAQPKVVDQAIASMVPRPAMPQPAPTVQTQNQAETPTQQAAMQLPESQGIGALPAQNLQGMGHAKGGIIGFDEGGVSKMTPDQWRQYALSQAQAKNLDPQFVDAILSHESKTKTHPNGYDPTAQSGTGPVGIGQITRFIGKSVYGQRNGIDPETIGKGPDVDQRFDPKKNIDTSLDFMAHLQDKYKGDKRKMALAYNQGETFLDRHLKDNNGEVNVAQLKGEPKTYLTKTVEKLIPSAQAGELPKTTTPSNNSDIPAAITPEQMKALNALPKTEPARAHEKPGSLEAMWNSIKEGYQSPTSWDDIKRDAANTLNALGGWSSPVSMVGRGVGAASKGLAATPEMVTAAEKAAAIANTPRLTGPAAEGIAALSPEAQALREAGENARRARLLAQDQQAALNAENSVKAANMASDTARGVEQSLAEGASNLGTQGTQLSTASRGMNAADLLSGNTPTTGGIATLAGAGAGANTGTDTTPPSAPPSPLPDKKVQASAKSATTGGLDNDTLLMLGLGLMGSTSPNFLTNVGQAGLGAVKSHQEQLKEAADTAYKQAMAAHYGVPAEVQTMEWLKDPKNMAMYQQMQEARREPMTKEGLYKQFMSSPTALGLSPEAIGPAFKNYVKSYEDIFGPLGGLPQGTKVTRIGQ